MNEIGGHVSGENEKDTLFHQANGSWSAKVSTGTRLEMVCVRWLRGALHHTATVLPRLSSVLVDGLVS